MAEVCIIDNLSNVKQKKPTPKYRVSFFVLQNKIRLYCVNSRITSMYNRVIPCKTIIIQIGITVFYHVNRMYNRIIHILIHFPLRQLVFQYSHQRFYCFWV